MVYFRKKSEHDNCECITTNDKSCSLEITDLPLTTKFVVIVRACTDSERGTTGDETGMKIKDASTLRQGTKTSRLCMIYPFINNVTNLLRSEYTFYC